MAYLPGGTRSPGCYTCRKKKVKCDKERPSCQRCLKSGWTCPGYPSDGDLVVRDMSKYAEAKVKTRVGNRVYKHMDKDEIYSVACEMIIGASACRTIKANHGPTQECSKSIPPPISTNWEVVAIPRLFADYIYHSNIVHQSELRFIRELSGKADALQEALWAVALLNLSNQTKQDFLAVKASEAHHRSIGLMARALDNPIEARSDSILAASFMISLYNLIGAFGLEHGCYTFNLQGRLSLLQFRGEEQFKTARGRNLWAVNYTGYIMKCITNHWQPVEAVSSWLHLGAGPNKPANRLSKFNLRIAQFCANAQVLFDSKIQDSWWIVALLNWVKDAILLDGNYQDWSESESEVWRYKECHTSSLGMQHIYHDLAIAFLWNNYRSIRIHLHEVLLHCISLIQTHEKAETISFNFEETQKESTSVISEMVSDIRTSMTFCLGSQDSTGKPLGMERGIPIAGYFAVYPLYLAMVSAEDNSEMESWLGGRLMYISNSMGIRLAGFLACREKKNPWDLR